MTDTLPNRPRDPLCDQLRAIRLGLGFSLADVEFKSGGRWKAVVVGSYERGDRQPNVRAARELLDFYGLRLEVLAPGDVVLTDDRPAAGQSHVEYLVVYGRGLDGTIACDSEHEATTIARYMPGARVAHRTHIVGELTFVDGVG